MGIWSKNIFILGAGDRGTAAAIRLFHSGFRPVLVERENPTDLYYFRNFSDVVYQGEKIVDHTSCVYLGTQFTNSEIDKIRLDRRIPCITLENIQAMIEFEPDIVIDCTGCFPEPIVLDVENYKCLIRIGAHFRTGRNGHFIIGDSGLFLGRILPFDYPEGEADAELSTCIIAPLEGLFVSDLDPGGRVMERQKLGQINDINILAPDHGLLAGRLHSGHYVSFHQPLFNIIHPRSARQADVKEIPSVKYSIAGGILEAILVFLHTEHLKQEREKNP